MYHNDHKKKGEKDIQVILDEVKAGKVNWAYVSYVVYVNYQGYIVEGIMYEFIPTNVKDDNHSMRYYMEHEGLTTITENQIIFERRLNNFTKERYAGQVYCEYPRYTVTHTRLSASTMKGRKSEVLKLALIQNKFLDTVINELRNKSYVTDLVVGKDIMIEDLKGKEIMLEVKLKDGFEEFNEIKYIVYDNNTGTYSTTVVESLPTNRLNNSANLKGRLELIKYMKPNGYICEDIGTVELDSEGYQQYKTKDGSLIYTNNIIERTVAVHSGELKVNIPYVTETVSERRAYFSKVYKKGEQIVIGINVHDSFKDKIKWLGNIMGSKLNTRQVNEFITFAYVEVPQEKINLGKIKEYLYLLEGEFEDSTNILRKYAGVHLDGIYMNGNNTLQTCSHRGETYYRDRDKTLVNETEEGVIYTREPMGGGGMKPKTNKPKFSGLQKSGKGKEELTGGLLGRFAKLLGGDKK